MLDQCLGDPFRLFLELVQGQGQACQLHLQHGGEEVVYQPNHSPDPTSADFLIFLMLNEEPVGQTFPWST